MRSREAAVRQPELAYGERLVNRQAVASSAGGLYGDVVEDLDRSTGAVLDAIAGLRLEERTLVVITSDNPRDEPPQAILAQILAGVAGHDEAGYESAIRTARREGLQLPMLDGAC